MKIASPEQLATMIVQSPMYDGCNWRGTVFGVELRGFDLERANAEVDTIRNSIAAVIRADREAHAAAMDAFVAAALSAKGVEVSHA